MSFVARSIGTVAVENPSPLRIFLAVADHLQPLVLHAAGLDDQVLRRFQARDLLRDVIHNRLNRGALGGLRLGVQVVHVDVVGHRDLAKGNGVQNVGLAAAVLADEPVARADVQLQRRVVQQRLAGDGHRELLDLGVARGGVGREHARHSPLLREHLLTRKQLGLARAPRGELRDGVAHVLHRIGLGVVAFGSGGLGLAGLLRRALGLLLRRARGFLRSLLLGSERSENLALLVPDGPTRHEVDLAGHRERSTRSRDVRTDGDEKTKSAAFRRPRHAPEKKRAPATDSSRRVFSRAETTAPIDTSSCRNLIGCDTSLRQRNFCSDGKQKA